MKHFFLISLLIPFCLFSSNINAQDLFRGYEHLFTPPLHYTAYRLPGKLKIDGKVDEKAWNKAQWSEYYSDIEGTKKPAPAFRTRCKMLWDTTYLYIAAELEEPHVWGKLTRHDQIIYNDNDFEVFIDPDNDTHHYFELEFNALNTVFDLYLSKPYRNQGQLRMDWNAKGLQSAVHVYGTVNTPGDTDVKWTIEIAIPFNALQLEGYTTPKPANGTTWRINFSRVQWDTEIKDGEYTRKVNPETGRRLPEHNWIWSPQGVINMHLPERWGYLQFSGNKAGKQEEVFVLPEGELVKKYLWLIYYKQKSYSREHKQYATQLHELGLPDTLKEEGEPISFKLSAVERKFEATVTVEKTGKRWRIDQDGKVEAL